MCSLATNFPESLTHFSLNTGYSLRLSTLRKVEVNEPVFYNLSIFNMLLAD